MEAPKSVTSCVAVVIWARRPHGLVYYRIYKTITQIASMHGRIAPRVSPKNSLVYVTASEAKQSPPPVGGIASVAALPRNDIFIVGSAPQARGDSLEFDPVVFYHVHFSMSWQ